MNPFAAIAHSMISSLDLRTPPVAVCLTDTSPDGVSGSVAPAAAGCVFWERGSQGAFVTSSRDHENCVVGMYTHHMSLESQPRQQDLSDCLKVFGDLGYLRPEDVPAVP